VALVTGGSSGIGGSGGNGGSSGSGGGVSCDDFADQSPPPEGVTIRLVNARNTPIYLGGDNNCAPIEWFELEGPEGPIVQRASGCGHTCQGLQQYDNLCPEACMVPPVVVIAPGGHYDTSWAGTTFEQAPMPISCYFNPEYAPTSCDRQLVAPAGSYVASAEAFTDVACTDLGICPCNPGPAGSCEIAYGSAPAGETIAAKVSFEHASTSVVEVTFY